MFKTKIVETLSHIEVFAGLAKDDLKAIAKKCQWVRFTQGETLIEIGKPSAGFFILTKGQVKVVVPERIEGKKERRASEIILNIMKEGDCFGEYSLIENKPGSASVIPSQPGEALKLEKSAFEDLMANDHIAKIIYRNLLSILIRRLRKKEQELDLVLIAG
jgi:CRP-like cAMP-binding protein